MSQNQTPIAFFVFNRPEPTQRVFAAIAAARPERLLIVADGPRAERAGEAERCEQVRAIVRAVDWPCRVETNFAAANMGCRDRIVSGLNWVFSQVEEAIILEDDCLPDPSFFPFCGELLERYRGNLAVGMISGTNLVESHLKTKYSYYFSQIPHIWGWATWRSSWQRYDALLSKWPEVREAHLLEELFGDKRVARYWARVYDQMASGHGPNTWDYQWGFTNFIYHALTVVPAVNLVANIGFGPEATHLTRADAKQQPGSRPLGFPLQHPPALIPLRSLDALDQKISFLPSLPQRIFGGPWRALKRLRGAAR